jgi:O-acetylhomoserine/O-acetylserine sulfhydrylase-like pyridoxal-dependent enzyme
MILALQPLIALHRPPSRRTMVHAGVDPDPVSGAILTPIYQSTTYIQESVDAYLEKG